MSYRQIPNNNTRMKIRKYGKKHKYYRGNKKTSGR